MLEVSVQPGFWSSERVDFHRLMAEIEINRQPLIIDLRALRRDNILDERFVQESLGTFLDKTIILQSSRGLSVSILCAEEMEEWIGRGCRLWWKANVRNNSLLQFTPLQEHCIKLVEKSFINYHQHEYKTRSITSMVELLRVGVHGGSEYNFVWCFHVQHDSVELHCIFDTDSRFGDAGGWAIFRNDDRKYISRDFWDDPAPIGFSLNPH